jgi:hypothetical protein
LENERLGKALSVSMGDWRALSLHPTVNDVEELVLSVNGDTPVEDVYG